MNVLPTFARILLSPVWSSSTRNDVTTLLLKYERGSAEDQWNFETLIDNGKEYIFCSQVKNFYNFNLVWWISSEVEVYLILVPSGLVSLLVFQHFVMNILLSRDYSSIEDFCHEYKVSYFESLFQLLCILPLWFVSNLICCWLSDLSNYSRLGANICQHLCSRILLRCTYRLKLSS